MKKKLELVFIPPPFMGHMTQMVELAKLMVDRDARLSITFLMIELPVSDPVGSSAMKSFHLNSGAGQERGHEETMVIRYVHLPIVDPDPEWEFKTVGVLHSLILEHQKPYIKDLVTTFSSTHNTQLVGFVVDMLCSTLIDVANEIGLPGYVFFASNASFLGLMLHFQTLHDHHNQDIAAFKHPAADTDLEIPSYAVPLPPAVLPFVLLDKRSWTTRFLHYARGYRKAKAIIVNTFSELEPYALHSLSSILSTTSIYPVGPILSRTQLKEAYDQTDILKWLDHQPPSSVVFMCFGSRGGFPEEQVKEIATGVEQSGYRFLWSLRQLPGKGKAEFPGKYPKQGLEVLPEGFLDRTAGRGKVINGWVGQLQVLSHPAVGGFMSHCGWNSILESLWCGVPVATLPIHAEQQVNAFQMVREFGLSAEISLDYHQQHPNHDDDADKKLPMVMAAQVEEGIRRVMEEGGGDDDSRRQLLRNKVKEMAGKAKMAMQEGGSSYIALQNLIDKEVIAASN